MSVWVRWNPWPVRGTIQVSWVRAMLTSHDHPGSCWDGFTTPFWVDFVGNPARQIIHYWKWPITIATTCTLTLCHVSLEITPLGHEKATPIPRLTTKPRDTNNALPSWQWLIIPRHKTTVISWFHIMDTCLVIPQNYQNDGFKFVKPDDCRWSHKSLTKMWEHSSASQRWLMKSWGAEFFV